MSLRWHLTQTVRHITRGGIVAYPTEAVYGLGCDPLNAQAVERLLRLKQRDWRKGLILIASDFSQLQPFLHPLSAEMQHVVFTAWQQSHAVTWLLPALPDVPTYLRGTSDKLAVRVTKHPVAAALCQHWGGALVSTSANRSKHPAAKTASRTRYLLGYELDYLLVGATGGQARPSEIRDATTLQTIRY
ncbi:L-threonylcarbamoyladenylate synthase [Beggiatoa leptomitoformis]|uniref:Threonylcarbamoyl-AMP synthase n=1 Tax=Beggiatoa leptomitoformis TaxID=288004 RepID=A0A2N9YIE7_9GAMM|nr:Sua5/YciO/YrdC/YwlC family protein [Beggiatoa leptomitoformis]ALG67452.1 tRNA threonylcarbamoyladenosine biosynthesis protein RimN [Beggiatoa leptomitoformis]AUI70331.1 tRNA threonylcarbamoyladenosine biosynthesis protein RimN [Beggiatoa leptomitoformis]